MSNENTVKLDRLVLAAEALRRALDIVPMMERDETKTLLMGVLNTVDIHRFIIDVRLIASRHKVEVTV